MTIDFDIRFPNISWHCDSKSEEGDSFLKFVDSVCHIISSLKKSNDEIDKLLAGLILTCLIMFRISRDP